MWRQDDAISDFPAAFDYWENRILFYLSRMYTEQLKKGESYENLQKCIHVSILDFIHFPDDEKCYRTISFCDIETGDLYSDLMEIQILELKKLQKEGNNEERWECYEKGMFWKEKLVEEFQEEAEILGCSRQNIDDLTRRGKLHPLKTTGKSTLYLKSEVSKRNWQ